ncbi:urotensin-2 isoform X2 [Hemicordylus capensis]|uniref:urotensin-2 isoform X2 n=1 Tax=Hemicordylus capensis TaxID=884348 RepID=UPI0023029776|nr:urotensin-2 isoform X2 [Hemicordylus capensis]
MRVPPGTARWGPWGSGGCCCCLLLLGLSGPLWALPLGSSGEIASWLAAADAADARLNLEALNSRSGGPQWQAVPGLLGAQANGSPSKAGHGPNSFTPRESVKEVLLGSLPRNTWLSRLLGKERKQDKKRGGGGNLPECFWKYCV